MAAISLLRPGQGTLRRIFVSCRIGRNAAELLEAVEHPLDAVCGPCMPVVASGRFFRLAFGGMTGLIPWIRSSSRRDHRHSLCQQGTASACGPVLQQVRNGVESKLPARQDEAERASLSVCLGVDFHGKTAA